MYRRNNSPPPFDSAPPSYSNLPSYAEEDMPESPTRNDDNQAVRLLTHADIGGSTLGADLGRDRDNLYDGHSFGAPSSVGYCEVIEPGRETQESRLTGGLGGGRLGGARPAYSRVGAESYVTTSSYDAQSSIGGDAPAPLRPTARSGLTGERPYVTKPLEVHVSRVSKDFDEDQDQDQDEHQADKNRGESSPRRKAVGFQEEKKEVKAIEYKKPVYTASIKLKRKDKSPGGDNEGKSPHHIGELMRKDKSPGERDDRGQSPDLIEELVKKKWDELAKPWRKQLGREKSMRESRHAIDEFMQKRRDEPIPTRKLRTKARDANDELFMGEETAKPAQKRKLRLRTNTEWSTQVHVADKLPATLESPTSSSRSLSTTLPPLRTSTPLSIDFSSILPSIPDGPPRRRSLRKSHTVKLKRKDPGPGYKVSSSHNISAPAGRRSYQPTVQTQQHSRETSLVDPPILAPVHPPETAYDPFNSGRASPTRSWSPSKVGSSISRPPSIAQYERQDLNGSPRPGSPTRRPLPPAPLFSGAGPSTSRFGDDASVSIPLDEDEENMQTRQGLRSRSSYNSDDSYADEMDRDADEKSNLDLYGPAPEGRQERRGARTAQRTKKAVKLINGELILECKIPTILYSFLPRRDEVEFTHMRYTAVTCDPDHFVEKGYKLRQQITNRETELFICVTMYNEDEINFTRTMHAVMKNIAHFCSRSKSRTWGENGWQKIVVCIVSDGRTKIHPRTLDALAAMGVYQDGIAKNLVNQKEVQAHVYEYTTQVSLDSDLKFKGAEKGIVPVQMIFCLKEKNAKKLNSHRWFFNAFGRALTPNICILLDVGTKPTGNSLYHLWKAFDTDSNVAGACGEIVAMKGKGWLGLLNPLVASQNFEYKMSNILDKPLESVFGYITVLPGALSAYRYHALQNDATGHGPLSQYFKGETLHGQNADVFTANMYLAEDRILCWELVAKRDERWVLKYVKNCKGETDVPDSVPEFVSQRRRWLNGAFFAAVYSLVHFKQIWTTDHTVARKILLHIEFVYQFLSLLFTFFSLANFYLTFYFVAGSLADPLIDPFGHSIGKYIFYFLKYICILCICTQFILSMGNRPQGAKKLYFTSMVIYGVIMIYTTFATIYIVVRQFTGKDANGVSLGNNIFTNLAVSLASTIGLYFYSSFLYLDPWHMFTSSAQYFALLPSYICTLQIYAFCNTHDISWGTKGDNTIHTDLGTAKGKGGTVELDMPSEQLDIDSGYDEALRNLRDRIEVPEPGPSEATQQEDYYRAVRTYMVVCWMVANAILAMSISEAYQGTSVGSNWYLKFLLWSVAAIALFRALGSTVFRIIEGVGKAVEAKAKYQSGQLGFGLGLGGSNKAASTVVSSSKLANRSVWDKMKDLGENIADKFGDLKDKFSKK